MTVKYSEDKSGLVSRPFFLNADNYQYTNSINDPQGKDCYLPLEIDTEYKTCDYDLNYPNQIITDIISVQIKSTVANEGIIYCHPSTISNTRHKKFKKGFAPIQYLIDLGYKADINRKQTHDVLVNLPTIQVDVYAFFALVDVNKICTSAYTKDIVDLALNQTTDGIKMERRIRATTKVKGKVTDYCYLPWTVTINEYRYSLKLSIKDTSAVQGNSNYASFCKNSNVNLTYKDTFSNDEKGRMDEMNLSRPIDFDNYALDDLNNHEALLGNSKIFEKIYKSLNITEAFTLPKLTTGSTITNLFMTVINKKCGHMPLDNKDLINAFCKPASVEGLEHLKTSTAGLCLKVDGGRCRNNRPTDVVIEGVICDLDISGAYTESMREQIYPVGVPVVIDYNPKSSCNEYQSLRQFLKSYQDELIPGLWVARVTVREGYELKHSQDFFASWKPPKDLYKLVTDSENLSEDEWWDNVDNIGVTKVLNYEITNASLTHDTLQWIQHIATSRQRKELLDNLMIHAAIYYPKSERVDTANELINQHQNWKGINTTKVRKVKGRTTKIVVQQECHKWFGFNLSEASDLLAIERKKYDKKTSENELFKLTINTIYGVMVSPFFTISNVVVGNNITGRVRTLAWCMEKGLNGFQTITDGCAFDINRVLNTINNTTTIKGLSSTLLTHIPSMISKGCASVKPLPFESCNNEIKLQDNGSLLFINGNITNNLNPSASKVWVNQTSMQHLQSLFTGLDVLHKETKDIYGNNRKGIFEFEAKGFYNKGIFQGGANYMLCMDKECTVKYRSYPRKFVRAIDYLDVENEKLLIEQDGKYQPAKAFLESLLNPNKVLRSKAFLQQQILKPTEWKKHYKKWQRSQVVWGDTIEKVRLLKEFSLSQFTYQTFDQYRAWEREYTGLMRRYGQSYEMFFLNDDETLDFEKMILDIEQRVRRGDMGFFDGVNRHKEHSYRNYSSHPAKECVEALKKMLMYRYKLTSAELPYADKDTSIDDDEKLISED